MDIKELLGFLECEKVEFKELGELCKINGGKLNANKAQPKGLYEFFTYDYNNPKFVDNYAWDTEALIICKKDNGENPCRYFNGKFNAFQWMRILHSFKNEANIHYIKYYFNAIFMQFLQTNSINISLPYIAIETIKKFQIPLPPLEIQQKIVEILDSFTELQAELQAELHARRKQYEYYRNKLLSFEELEKRANAIGGLKLVRLGEVCEVKRGVRVTKKDLTENEKYPVFQNSLTPMGYYNQSNVNANTPFIIVGGSAGEIGWSSSSYWAADDCIYFICEKSLMNRFLYHALCNQQHYFLSQVRKASIPRLSQDCIKKVKIPLPPLEVQNDIVEILDKFDALANDLSAGLPAEIDARQKQYEHYREQLLSFREKCEL